MNTLFAALSRLSLVGQIAALLLCVALPARIHADEAPGPDKHYTVVPPTSISVSVSTADFGLGPKVDGDWVVSCTSGPIAVGALPGDGSYALVGTYSYQIEDWNWTISNGNGEYRLDNVTTGTGNVYARQEPVVVPPLVNGVYMINKLVGDTVEPYADAMRLYTESLGHASGREQESFTSAPGSSAAFSGSNFTFDVAGTYVYELMIGVEDYWGREVGADIVTINYVVSAPMTTPSVSVTPLSSSVTAGDSVTFTASGGQNSYVWGGSAGGSGASQTVNFPAPGTYSVTVYSTAGGSYNQSNTASATISVSPAITPTTFTFGTKSHVYDGSVKTATVSPSPGNATYNSTLSGGPNAGSYPISATAFGSFSGTGSDTLTITRATPGIDTPAVTVSPASSTITAGASIAFSASNGPNGYVWGGSASGSGSSTVVVFPTAGSYSVTVYSPAGGNYNQSNVATATITVNPAPVPTAFSFGALAHTYDGSVKSATVLPNPANATYTASLTGGPNVGSYPVSATGTGIFTGTSSGTLVISKATPPVWLSPASATVPFGGSVTLTAAGGPNAYVWGGDAPGINVSAGSSQSLTFSALGTFTVTVYSQDGGNFGQSNTASATITVVPAPTTFVFGGLSHIYDGATKSATATPNPAGATFSSSLESPSSDAGAYPVSATATGNYSGSASDTLVIARSTPGVDSPGVSLTPAFSSINAGDSIAFTAANGHNGYIWGGDASGAGSTKIVPFPVAGSYTVTVYSPAGGNYNASNVATATIVVTTIPTTFSFSGTAAVYDGTMKAATVLTNPVGATYTADLIKGPDAGSYTVSAVATGAFSGSGSGTLTISPAQPVVSVSPDSATVAVGGSLTLTSSGGQNAYVWGGSASGSGDTQTVVFPAPGVFTVTVYSTPGGNYDTSLMATSVITVAYPVPTVSLTVDSMANAIKWKVEHVASARVALTRVAGLGTAEEQETAVVTIASEDAEYAGKPFEGSTQHILPTVGSYRARLIYVPMGGGPPVTNMSTITLSAAP